MRQRIPIVVLLILIGLAFVACVSDQPNPSGSPSGDPTPAPVATPTASPSPTPVPEVEVPLVVVTGYTNPRAAITEAEVAAAIDADTFIQQCEFLTAVNPVPRCLDAGDVVEHLLANPTDL